MTAVSQASREFHASGGIKPVTLWIQALTEAGEDEEIRSYLRRQLREVHDYIAAAVRRAQVAGGVPQDRDPDAEAWIFVGAAPTSLRSQTASAACSARTTSRRWPPSASAGSPAPSKRLQPSEATRGLARTGICSADPVLLRPKKNRSSPAAAPGTICEASCHEGDTPSDVTLRPSHGTTVAAVAFWVARPCTRPGVGRASWPHCRSQVRKSQVGRSSDFVVRFASLVPAVQSRPKIPAKGYARHCTSRLTQSTEVPRRHERHHYRRHS